MQVCSFLYSKLAFSQTDISDKTFKEHQDYTKTVTINRCIFQSCQHSKKGGACKISNYNTEAKILETGFLECSSSQGGALYVQEITMLTLKNVCIDQCQASEKGSVAIITSDAASIGDIAVSLSKSSEDGSNLQIESTKESKISGINSTQCNSDSPFLSLVSTDLGTTIERLHFVENKNGKLLFRFTAPPQGIKFVNFYKNNVDVLMESTSNSKIINSYIVRNQGDYYISKTSELISFYNSHFADDSSAKDVYKKCQKDGSIKIVEPAEYDIRETYNMKFDDVQLCWQGDKQGDTTPSERTISTTFLIIFALVGCTGLGITAYCCLSHYKKRSDQAGLLGGYSMVPL